MTGGGDRLLQNSLREVIPLKNKFFVLIVAAILFSSAIFSQEDEKDKGAFEDRIKVGFASFDNKASAVKKQGGSYRSAQFDLGAFTTMISTALVKTRRFEVIERQDLDKILEEQGLVASGIVNEDLGAVSGRIRGVQFLMTGSITKCGFTSIPVQVGKYKQDKDILELGVDFKVVNTTTGNIAVADFIEVTEEQTSISGSGYSSSTSSENLIANAMRKASLQAAFLVANAIVPLKIDAVQPSKGIVKLNYGAGFIEKDQYYRVFPNDDEGSSWEASFDEVGKIKITTVTQTYAIGKVMSGTFDEITEGCSAIKVSPDEEKQLLDSEKVKANDSMTRRFGY